MPDKINGASGAYQSLAGVLQYYVVYCKSPLAYTDPDPNPPPAEEATRILNIQTTDDMSDQSQKNFEILLQSICLRATPVIMNDPEAVGNLAMEGAPTLTGEGFVWKYSVELDGVWEDYDNDDPVGLLISELDGVIISSGVRITTVDGSPSAVPKNIEFIRVDTL